MAEKINKIENFASIKNKELGEGEGVVEITIKDADTGEVIYREETKAGILGTMEKVNDCMKTGEIDGTHQILIWGNFLHSFHAFLMLKKYLKENSDKILDKLSKRGLFKKDPVESEKIVREFIKNNLD